MSAEGEQCIGIKCICSKLKQAYAENLNDILRITWASNITEQGPFIFLHFFQ
jgi:hypothetical protein